MTIQRVGRDLYRALSAARRLYVLQITTICIIILILPSRQAIARDNWECILITSIDLLKKAYFAEQETARVLVFRKLWTIHVVFAV